MDIVGVADRLIVGIAEAGAATGEVAIYDLAVRRTGLTRFLPASLSPDGSELTPIQWQGSSDVPAVARANV